MLIWDIRHCSILSAFKPHIRDNWKFSETHFHDSRSKNKENSFWIFQIWSKFKRKFCHTPMEFRNHPFNMFFWRFRRFKKINFGFARTNIFGVIFSSDQLFRTILFHVNFSAFQKSYMIYLMLFSWHSERHLSKTFRILKNSKILYQNFQKHKNGFFEKVKHN